MCPNIVEVNKIAESGCKPLVDNQPTVNHQLTVRNKKPSCANRRATIIYWAITSKQFIQPFKL
jgi:hypothetical protein